MQKSYIYIDPNCDPAVNSDAFRILQDKPLWSPMPTANSDFTRQLTLPTKKLIKLNQPSEMKLIGNSDYKTTSSQWVAYSWPKIWIQSTPPGFFDHCHSVLLKIRYLQKKRMPHPPSRLQQTLIRPAFLKGNDLRADGTGMRTTG